MFKKLSKPLKWLVIFLLVIVVASIGASLVQNSFWSVKVTTEKFETANGELAGYLYMPKGVDADNPAPAVLLTHGYLNNAEMQEIAAIELSRRGYVVLAFSMYDHGDSTWDTPAQFSFYVSAMYDAVQYMYDQDYVLKDELGNGMIGISGHSMGGFASTCAVYLDEVDFATNGYRKIAASLPAGADYRYIPWGQDATLASYGTRSIGHIASHYDQFFFENNPTADQIGSVFYKDFTSDPTGLAFLGRTAEGTAEASVFYSDAGGQRVIFTPDETHPQNTWSLETGGDTINFFETAFTYQLGLHDDLGTLDSYGIETGKTGQVWWLKEAFTLTALLALIAMIIPAFMLISNLPVLKKVYASNMVISTKKETDKIKLIVKGVLLVGLGILNAFLVKTFMDRADGLGTLATICWIVFGVAVAAVIAFWVMTLVNKNPEKAEALKKLTLKVSWYALALVVITMLYRWLLVNSGEIVMTDHYYSAPSVNTIVYWAMASGGLILLVTVLSGFYFNLNSEDENAFGLKVKPLQLGLSILNALALVVGILFLVAVVGWVFLTDFRFYTYAIQIFNTPQFIAALRYIPLFFIYYFAAGISVFVNTKNVKGWLGDVFAAALLAGPVVLFLIIQYIPLYSSGTAYWPTFSLSSILCVGLVPTLAIAGIIMRRLSLKTGNIWTGVFFTSIFFTLITLANTTVYLLTAV